MTSEDDFEAVAPDAQRGEQFILDLEGYEGPLDALLGLAREQKVDLTRISILQLADQFLEFVARARALRLEVAADYLVMAAWLAYLKSRLLLPAAESDDEPSGEQLAAALAFQLRRLEAMQEAGTRLMARARLGQDFFAKGAPERFASRAKSVFEVGLYDLLKAYGDQVRRTDARTLRIEVSDLYSPDQALRHLRGLLGGMADWTSLLQFLPGGGASELFGRSALASTLVAALQLTKEGKINLRQSTVNGPYKRLIAEVARNGVPVTGAILRVNPIAELVSTYCR